MSCMAINKNDYYKILVKISLVLTWTQRPPKHRWQLLHPEYSMHPGSRIPGEELSQDQQSGKIQIA